MILRIYQYFCGLFHEKCQQNNLYVFSNYVINNHVNGYVQFICTNPIEISLSILLKLIKLIVQTRYFAEFFFVMYISALLPRKDIAIPYCLNRG
jgi:hypothetical protein